MLQGIVAPANAAVARIKVDSTTGDAGDSFWTDRLFFHKGAGGQWAMPGTPITGQSHIATNGAVHLSGTGTPEGVVTAAPGSTWLQTDATTDVKGWLRWFKASGTGNTGWIAGPEADTGWRLISASLINGWTSGGNGLRIRRKGGTVMMVGDYIVGTSATNGQFLAIPTGMRAPLVPIANTSIGTSTGAAPSVLFLYGADYIATANPTTISSGRFGITYLTDDAWPSSLPGSAV
jgi:hypothetical protein